MRIEKYKKQILIIGNILAIVVATIFMIKISDIEKFDSTYDVDQYSKFVKIEYLDNGISRYYLQLENTDDYPMSLAIRTSFQTLKVYLQDELFYSLDTPTDQLFLDMPASQWNIIPIPVYAQNSVVMIEYYSSYEAYENYTPTIYWGQETDLLSSLISKTFIDNILSWITILAGIVTLILCYILNKTSFKYMKYLSLFLLMFGIWTWGEAKSYFFNYAPLNIQTNITLYLVMLMPIPLMLYLNNNPKAFYFTKSDSNKLIRVYLIASIAEVLLGTVLYAFNIMDLIEYLKVSLVFLGAGAIILVSFEVKSAFEKINQREVYNSAPIIILAISCVLEMLAFFRGDLFCTGIYSKIGVLIFVTNIYIEELGEKKREEQKLIQLEKALLQANIHMMTSKMKPHFIHNTLLAIQELCYSDPKQAYNAIGLFSKYLRVNIEGIDKEDLVTFEKELEYINIYIEIQKMCYEDAIIFDTDISFKDFKIPPFTIQPIIENSISHGILKSRKKGSVKLRTWLRDDLIFIEVTDNGIGFDLSKSSSEYFNSGDAVMFRVKHILKGDIVIQSSIDVGTTVLVTIPNITESDGY
ncbi:MAG: histidine kinase [Lachnospiraceae bacterium]